MKRMMTTPADAMSTIDGAVETVRLAAGDLEAEFAPGVGMAGVSLRHRGIELLDLRDGLTAYEEHGAVMGIPLLHPWANRLDALGYEVDGRRVDLPVGAPLVHCDEHGLPIHGVLNASPHWHLAQVTRDRLVAELDFGAHPELLAAFPFPHVLTLDIAIDPAELEIAATVRATGSDAVPIAFGFHPYLRSPGTDRSGWEVSLPARRHLSLDERGIPAGGWRREPARRFKLDDRSFDDGYDELADGAVFRLDTTDRTVEVAFLRGYAAAQVFSPPGAQFICFEPMTAPTNALRSGAGLRRVAPGDSFTAAFRIRVSAAPPRGRL